MFFITLEGNEGSGKSTILKRLFNYYQENNLTIFTTREPGSSRNIEAEKIRNMIMSTNYNPQTELLLYMTSRSLNIIELDKIRKDYEIIISDRFYHSSAIYQGYIYKYDNNILTAQEIIHINKKIFEKWIPDLTFILLVDPIVGLKRIEKSNREVNKYDIRKKSFHNLVFEGYQWLINDSIDRDKIIYIDANKSIDECFELIIKTINHYRKSKINLYE